MKAGSLIVFTKGEYSDYSLIDHFLVLQDIPRTKIAEIQEEIKRREAQDKAALDKYRAEYSAWSAGGCVGQAPSYPNTTDAQVTFISLLIREGFLLSISVTEYHLGSYGELEIEDLLK